MFTFFIADGYKIKPAAYRTVSQVQSIPVKLMTAGSQQSFKQIADSSAVYVVNGQIYQLAAFKF